MFVQKQWNEKKGVQFITKQNIYKQPKQPLRILVADICNSVYDQNLTKSDTLWDRTEHRVPRWNAVSTLASHCYGLWVFTTSLTVSKQASSEIRSHKIAVWLQEILRGTKTASDSLPCLLLGKPPRSQTNTNNNDLDWLLPSHKSAILLRLMLNPLKAKLNRIHLDFDSDLYV